MTGASHAFGAIEVGGTKIICGVGDATAGSREAISLPTRDPDTTTGQIVEFFQAARTRYGELAAIGIGSFGPLDLHPSSPTFGQITTTPKPGWQGVDLPARLREALGVTTAIDTDVNAAAVAEMQLGAAKGRQSVAYVTVGTGIGVGIATGGRTLHNLGHPEAGHLLPRRHPLHDSFRGICPFHGDCLEGLAAGPAIKAAWGGPLASLPAAHPAWTLEADYLGQLCATLILTVSPEHIVLGGGVMSHGQLLEPIVKQTLRYLAGYVRAWTNPADAGTRITLPGCHEASGLIGAYLLAETVAPELANERKAS